jgi:hypothetical protein
VVLIMLAKQSRRGEGGAVDDGDVEVDIAALERAQDSK